MRIADLLIGAGVVLIVVGLLARFGLLSWFGRLPGDIRVEGDNGSLYVPIVSMLLVSVVGSIILNVVLRFFRG